ncbi:PLDc N-terminal domain-containing protein [Cecembia calidifontis]|uniref:Phospholipase D-like protein n=1 Tax=Cecembia calidifontis TaxID=1187080 RepID=A0A4Q7PAD5_9BACT|nr:PLD nuclease N-terminal domain-containing protein [Cecembia calidifontis]RZS95712.1 phospholipase D-like protein [Cecembia calidifontis]
MDFNSDFAVFIVVLSIVYTIIWVWAIVDLIKSKFKDSNMKLVWAVVLIFANPIGPIVYFILSGEQKTFSQKHTKN